MKMRNFVFFSLLIFSIIIFNSCVNLSYLEDKDDSNTFMDHSDISPVNSYIPDLIKLAEREYDEDVLVVGYENLSDLENFMANLDQGIEVKSLIREIKVALLNLDGQNVEKILNDLENEEKIEGIRYIEPNYTDREIQVIKNGSNVIIEETGSSALNQVEVYPDYREFQYALDLILSDTETAWATATGKGVIVGLLDTGTDGTHPDLVGQLVEGYDPLNPTTPILPDEDSDTDGHGTHTAGIIAAKDDGQGVVGLAPDAKIMPIRIFNPGYIGDYDVAEGIVWAVDHGANVLSNSWGGRGYSNILKDAFDYALTNNVVVVASSGNFTTDQHWFYPSGFPGVIAVAASDDKDNIAYFSSRGDYVSVSAPGVDIISTIPLELGEYQGIDGNPYICWSGTSMSAPYVSALAALIREKYPDANVYQIRKMIEDGAVDIGETGYDTAAGYGRISSDSLDLDPTNYTAGALRVEAISKRSGDYLPGVFITLENKETGKRYYGKTNDGGYELFFGIEPGDYEIIIGGPEYLYGSAPNYRMEEELSYSGLVEVEPVEYESIELLTETTVTTYIQKFETTQFKADLTADLSFEGTLTISLLDENFDQIKTFEFPSNEEISIDLLQHIIKSGHYYLAYEYVGAIPEGEFGISGEIQINNDSIPVTIPINQEGTGFIDEYGGDEIPWTIF